MAGVNIHCAADFQSASLDGGTAGFSDSAISPDASAIVDGAGVSARSGSSGGGYGCGGDCLPNAVRHGSERMGWRCIHSMADSCGTVAQPAAAPSNSVTITTRSTDFMARLLALLLLIGADPLVMQPVHRGFLLRGASACGDTTCQDDSSQYGKKYSLHGDSFQKKSNHAKLLASHTFGATDGSK